MKAQGLDVVSFAAGEPDFDTPVPICQAAIESIQQGKTRYTASSGIPELKQAICEKLANENGIDVNSDQIIVSCGAKHSIYNALQVLVNPGDEVILIAPYWMTYYDQIVLAGGTPVVIYTTEESGYTPTVEQLNTAISPKTKAIILNSPTNPTGAMLSYEILQSIADAAIKNNFWIISDEIYERLVYGATAKSITSVGPEVMDRIVLVGGCSKTYAMTGWRIGFACAPIPVVKAMSNLQDQVTSNPTSFAQYGAVAAFRMGAETVEKMRAEFQARRDLAVSLLRAIPNVTVHEPSGAFYVFPSMKAYLGNAYPTDVELCDYLLESALVATVPGTVFEGPGHLRLSYAASRQDIERGIQRIAASLAKM